MSRKVVTFLLVQLLALSMCCCFAFATDIFQNANNMLSGWEGSLLNLAKTVSVIVGVVSAICYMLSSSERTCERAKSWFIRSVVGLVLCFLVSSDWISGMVSSMFQ